VDFIRELQKKLINNKLEVSITGVADFKQQKTIDWLESDCTKIS
jgi:hypothetical protein